MTMAVKLSLAASGIFLLAGMLTGVWKYRQMAKRPDHRSHPYVDSAHRAALLYSFAAVAIAELVRYSPYSTGVQLAAVSMIFFFFAVAVANFIRLAVTSKIDNQFLRRSFATTWGMYLLIAGEIGGFLIVLWGFLDSQVF